MNRFLKTLTQRLLHNLFLKEIESTCVESRDSLHKYKMAIFTRPSQPARIPSPRSMLSCDIRLQPETWNPPGLQENVFANPRSTLLSLQIPYPRRWAAAYACNLKHGTHLDYRKTFFLQIHARRSSHCKYFINELIHLWRRMPQVRLPRSSAQGNLWQERMKD